MDSRKIELGLVDPPPENGCRYKYTFDLGYCNRQRFEGYDMCFWHIPDTAKYQPQVIQRYFGKSTTLKEAMEAEVANGHSLTGAFLKSAQIGGDWFNKGVNLSGADLRGANLFEAHLSYGSLNGANLAMANLESAYLSDVDMRGAIFSGANLHNAKFRNSDFSEVKGLTRESFRGAKWGFLPVYHILETYPEQCEGVYRALASYFAKTGALQDASWAAYRERVTHRRLLKRKVRLRNVLFETVISDQLTGRKISLSFVYLKWLHGILELIVSYLYCFVFGYGEKPGRVLIISALTIITYALLYNYWGVLSESGFMSALYFSIVTFTTLGYGDILPKKEFRLIAASEAIFGILLIGLFLFALSRRAVGR